MPDSAAPDRVDFATQLPADAYSQLIRTLRLALPPPLGDSPEDLARRDHSAIARIAALAPANAAEADLAALFVAASEQVKECLRLAQLPDISETWAMKCRAQANSMLRQAQSAMRLLLRMQATRQKTEANAAASDRAAWTEHCAIGLMAEALPSPAENAAMPPSPTLEPLMEPETVAQPEPEPSPSDDVARARLDFFSSRSGLSRASTPLLAASKVVDDRHEAGHDYERNAEEVRTYSAADSHEPDPASAEASTCTYPHEAALLRQLQWMPANNACFPPEGEAVSVRMTFSPPNGIRLDRQFAETPTCLAGSETRQSRDEKSSKVDVTVRQAVPCEAAHQ